MAEPSVELFQFGYISRTHGLTGEVVVRTFDPTSTVLEEVEQVVARLKDGSERELTIEDVREGSKGDLLVSFEGLRRRVDADELRGSGLFVRRADLEEPEEGEYFQGDLVGLEAVTPEGARLGQVAEVWSTGPVPNLVIRDGTQEVLVPFAEDFVREVNLEARRVVVVRPEYEE
jgi:16S rRNA processing protein RimM